MIFNLELRSSQAIADTLTFLKDNYRMPKENYKLMKDNFKLPSDNYKGWLLQFANINFISQFHVKTTCFLISFLGFPLFIQDYSNQNQKPYFTIQIQYLSRQSFSASMLKTMANIFEFFYVLVFEFSLSGYFGQI